MLTSHGNTEFLVDKLRESDREEWEDLYRGYMDFYGRHDEPQAMYNSAWSRLLKDNSVHGLVARDARDETKLLGLVHFLPHPNISGKDRCYLQDLFTSPAARALGIGTRLIQSVVEWCRIKGEIGQVYWSTHQSNPARKKLYDVVGTHKGFVKYQIDV